MKINYLPTYKSLLLALAFFFINVVVTVAQHCSPTFLNGCALWNNQAITIGSINWTLGSTSCITSDYTTDTAYFNAGGLYPMMVTNGDWCGCGVWIDFNNDFVFDTTENLFHLYTASQTNNYSFNLYIPSNVQTGVYRMRVIAGWGTDCFTVSGNGYGPCGSYQYGNFDDFSASINALTTNVPVETENSAAVKAFPNPVTDLLTIQIPDAESNSAQLKLTDITGRSILDFPVTGKEEKVDFSVLTKGIYLLHYTDGITYRTLRIVK